MSNKQTTKIFELKSVNLRTKMKETQVNKMIDSNTSSYNYFNTFKHINWRQFFRAQLRLISYNLHVRQSALMVWVNEKGKQFNLPNTKNTTTGTVLDTQKIILKVCASFSIR